MKLKLLVVSLLGVCAFQARAQFGFHEDAIRYSQTNWLIGSTARMQGFGGAQTSLGGDLSSIGTNPAGLGFYNRSASVFSLGMDFQNSDDVFGVGNERFVTPNFTNQLGIRNAGFVMNFREPGTTDGKFKGGALGISFSKINDFNREYRYEGASGTSLMDGIVEYTDTNQTPIYSSVEEFENSGEYLLAAAYHQFLLEADDSNTTPDYYIPDGTNYIVPSPGTLDWYVSPFGAFSESRPYQEEAISSRGGQHQINLSWGGNYDDKFYFGAGLGIQTIYQHKKTTYQESDFQGSNESNDWINSIVYETDRVTRGGGFNGNFGAIFRPIGQLTLGISYQSPTFLTLREEESFDLSANWGNYYYSYSDTDFTDAAYLGDIEPYLSPIFATKYRIKTPSKTNLGATFFMGKTGFISADVEFVDYANAEIQSQDFSPLLDNQELLKYQSVMNYRLGAEFRMENLRFRGGLGMNQDPTGLGNDRTYTTLGFGYKSQEYFFDIALVNTKYQSQYSPYQLVNFDSPVVESDVKITTITVSTGFNF